MSNGTQAVRPPELFDPIAADYERWTPVLSLGQDRRWREAMVGGLGVEQGSLVMDLAAGTGLITRRLAEGGSRVVSVDLSPKMLSQGSSHNSSAVVGTAEVLPFSSGSFDALTFGYLLRYVEVESCLRELVRVLRSGGRIGMVEFARPTGIWRLLWRAHVRTVLPATGAVIGHGWDRVGRFLGPSIERFADQYPPQKLAAAWTSAGLVDVRWRVMSLGGGLVMWGRKP